MIILSQICYSFHYSVKRYCICFIGYYSCVVHRDELLVEHDFRVLIALLAMTLQWMVTLGLRPHDLVGSVVRLRSQSIWLSRLASGASFETYGVSFRPFQRIEICSSMPHWGIWPPHHFLAVWRLEPLFISGLRHSESLCHTFSSTFRATSSFSVQSHHRFSVSAFGAIIITFSVFGIQSHHRFLVSAFRAIIVFFDWRSESSSSLLSIGVQSPPRRIFSFGVRSHHYHVLSFQSSKPPSLFSFGFQSHHRVFCLTFRVIIITSQYRCSEPSLPHFQFRCSEPSLSRSQFSEFRATITF